MLQVLLLDDNRLSGTLPANWSAGFANLTYMTLQMNQLSGSLPGQWAPNAFFKLQVIGLQENQLEGNLPASWTGPDAFPSVRGQLDGIVLLPGNRLSGLLPQDLPYAVYEETTVPAPSPMSAASAPNLALTEAEQAVAPSLDLSGTAPATSPSLAPVALPTINLQGVSSLTPQAQQGVINAVAEAVGVQPSQLSLQQPGAAGPISAAALSVRSAPAGRRLMQASTPVSLQLNGATPEQAQAAQAALQNAVDSGALQRSLAGQGVDVSGVSLGNQSASPPASPQTTTASPASTVPVPAPSGGSNHLAAILGGAIGGGVALLLVVLVAVTCCVCRMRRAKAAKTVPKSAAPKPKLPPGKELKTTIVPYAQYRKERMEALKQSLGLEQDDGVPDDRRPIEGYEGARAQMQPPPVPTELAGRAAAQQVPEQQNKPKKFRRLQQPRPDLGGASGNGGGRSDEASSCDICCQGCMQAGRKDQDPLHSASSRRRAAYGIHTQSSEDAESIADRDAALWSRESDWDQGHQNGDGGSQDGSLQQGSYIELPLDDPRMAPVPHQQQAPRLQGSRAGELPPHTSRRTVDRSEASPSQAAEATARTLWAVADANTHAQPVHPRLAALQQDVQAPGPAPSALHRDEDSPTLKKTYQRDVFGDRVPLKQRPKGRVAADEDYDHRPQLDSSSTSIFDSQQLPGHSQSQLHSTASTVAAAHEAVMRARAALDEPQTSGSRPGVSRVSGTRASASRPAAGPTTIKSGADRADRRAAESAGARQSRLRQASGPSPPESAAPGRTGKAVSAGRGMPAPKRRAVITTPPEAGDSHRSDEGDGEPLGGQYFSQASRTSSRAQGAAELDRRGPSRQEAGEDFDVDIDLDPEAPGLGDDMSTQDDAEDAEMTSRGFKASARALVTQRGSQQPIGVAGVPGADLPRRACASSVECGSQANTPQAMPAAAAQTPSLSEGDQAQPAFPSAGQVSAAGANTAAGQPLDGSAARRAEQVQLAQVVMLMLAGAVLGSEVVAGAEPAMRPEGQGNLQGESAAAPPAVDEAAAAADQQQPGKQARLAEVEAAAELQAGRSGPLGRAVYDVRAMELLVASSLGGPGSSVAGHRQAVKAGPGSLPGLMAAPVLQGAQAGGNALVSANQRLNQAKSTFNIEMRQELLGWAKAVPLQAELPAAERPALVIVDVTEDESSHAAESRAVAAEAGVQQALVAQEGPCEDQTPFAEGRPASARQGGASDGQSPAACSEVHVPGAGDAQQQAMNGSAQQEGTPGRRSSRERSSTPGPRHGSSPDLLRHAALNSAAAARSASPQLGTQVLTAKGSATAQQPAGQANLVGSDVAAAAEAEQKQRPSSAQNKQDFARAEQQPDAAVCSGATQQAPELQGQQAGAFCTLAVPLSAATTMHGALHDTGEVKVQPAKGAGAKAAPARAWAACSQRNLEKMFIGRPDILKVWDLEMRLAKAECPRSVLHGAYIAVPLKGINGMRLRRIAKLTELPGRQDNGQLIFLKGCGDVKGLDDLLKPNQVRPERTFDDIPAKEAAVLAEQIWRLRGGEHARLTVQEVAEVQHRLKVAQAYIASDTTQVYTDADVARVVAWIQQGPDEALLADVETAWQQQEQATWHKIKRACVMYRGLKRKREERESLHGLEGTDDSQVRVRPIQDGHQQDQQQSSGMSEMSLIPTARPGLAEPRKSAAPGPASYGTPLKAELRSRQQPPASLSQRSSLGGGLLNPGRADEGLSEPQCQPQRPQSDTGTTLDNALPPLRQGQPPTEQPGLNPLAAQPVQPGSGPHQALTSSPFVGLASSMDISTEQQWRPASSDAPAPVTTRAHDGTLPVDAELDMFADIAQQPEQKGSVDADAWEMVELLRKCRTGWDGHIMVLTAVDQALPAVPASTLGGGSVAWRGSIIQQLHSSILVNALYGVLTSAAPSHAVELPVCIPIRAQAAQREASLLITLPCDWLEDLFTALHQDCMRQVDQVIREAMLQHDRAPLRPQPPPAVLLAVLVDRSSPQGQGQGQSSRPGSASQLQQDSQVTMRMRTRGVAAPAG
eukprot:jgi/Astpho2/9619/fgenesh1_pg.00146_%23_52_t